ncbi:Small HSP21-like protein [Aphelenchoides fujianensis]|nr:Small HSP21-like protein [Aphelenchoides fujianensis]
MELLPFVFADPLDYRPRRPHPLQELRQLDSLLNAAFRSADRDAAEWAADFRADESGGLALRCPTGGFRPEELSVELDGDRLVLAGRHAEERDGESVERHFRRVVRLPPHSDAARITCELDDGGFLNVAVPRLEPVEPPKKSIPIQHKQAGDDREASK